MSWYSSIKDWVSQTAGHEHVSPSDNEVLQDPPPLPPEFLSQFEEMDRALGLEVNHAHLDRNQYQDDIVPEHIPQDLPYFDPATSVNWERDNQITESIWHGADNDCVRGALPADMVADLRNDVQYRADFAHVAGDNSYDVDDIVPGAQACYGPDGNLIDSGPHQGTWDFASPGISGQAGEHFQMDVLTDAQSDDYASSNHDGDSYDEPVASVDNGDYGDGGDYTSDSDSSDNSGGVEE